VFYNTLKTMSSFENVLTTLISLTKSLNDDNTIKNTLKKICNDFHRCIVQNNNDIKSYKNLIYEKRREITKLEDKIISNDKYIDKFCDDVYSLGGSVLSIVRITEKIEDDLKEPTIYKQEYKTSVKQEYKSSDSENSSNDKEIILEESSSEKDIEEECYGLETIKDKIVTHKVNLNNPYGYNINTYIQNNLKSVVINNPTIIINREDKKESIEYIKPPIRERITELFNKGVKQKEIIEILNKEGYKSQKGGEVSQKMISNYCKKLK
jgi:hypothetical protein